MAHVIVSFSLSCFMMFHVSLTRPSCWPLISSAKFPAIRFTFHKKKPIKQGEANARRGRERDVGDSSKLGSRWYLAPIAVAGCFLFPYIGSMQRGPVHIFTTNLHLKI